jgi:hypothetical protein
MKRRAPRQRSGGRRGGFTLVEFLLASAIAVLVVGGTLSIYIFSMRFWHAISLRMEADRRVNMAMSRMVYGIDDRRGLRAASSYSLTSGGDGWTLSYATGETVAQSNSITYSASASNLVLNPGGRMVGENISLAACRT